MGYTVAARRVPWRIAPGRARRRRLRAAAAAAALAAGLASAPAGAAGCDWARGLEPAGRATVAEVGPRGGLLAEGGAEVRLAGVDLPRPEEPLAGEARAALAAAVLGREVALFRAGETARDRYGRALAHVCPPDGGWAQGRLLELGYARVATWPGAAALAARMLALERGARAAGRGVWARRRFRVRNPHETRRDIDSFQIVEGRVVAAARVRGRVYLNFGPDWRTDFTFAAGPPARRAFARAGIDLAGLAGRRVRGRGWVTLRNGPAIELTHPEQLEVLGE